MTSRTWKVASPKARPPQPRLQYFRAEGTRPCLARRRHCRDRRGQVRPGRERGGASRRGFHPAARSFRIPRLVPPQRTAGDPCGSLGKFPRLSRDLERGQDRLRRARPGATPPTATPVTLLYFRRPVSAVLIGGPCNNSSQARCDFDESPAGEDASASLKTGAAATRRLFDDQGRFGRHFRQPLGQGDVRRDWRTANAFIQRRRGWRTRHHASQCRTHSAQRKDRS